MYPGLEDCDHTNRRQVSAPPNTFKFQPVWFSNALTDVCFSEVHMAVCGSLILDFSRSGSEREEIARRRWRRCPGVNRLPMILLYWVNVVNLPADFHRPSTVGMERPESPNATCQCDPCASRIRPKGRCETISGGERRLRHAPDKPPTSQWPDNNLADRKSVV